MSGSLTFLRHPLANKTIIFSRTLCHDFTSIFLWLSSFTCIIVKHSSIVKGQSWYDAAATLWILWSVVAFPLDGPVRSQMPNPIIGLIFDLPLDSINIKLSNVEAELRYLQFSFEATRGRKWHWKQYHSLTSEWFIFILVK